ncbi:MAG: hypothetical protein HRU38_05750 [Saccharospirillaceae bacterium]|nr:ATP-binding protein [Pseudomonadales bacterium]NRB78160.1 hypothetical protein [Saccharospirillaceae bacterium]
MISTKLFTKLQRYSAELLIPNWLIYSTLAICILPLLLLLLGVDFGNHAIKLPINATVDDLFYRLSGAFTHTLLEWTAFCAALFTVALAFSHFSITKDITTPVIGVALFAAGCMDAFHTLAATRLIEAVADNTDLVPFTWAICRIFNALIMIIGVGMFLKKDLKTPKLGIKFLVSISLCFGVVAYLIIYFAATSQNLPQTQFPDALIRRPYDIIPLVLFLFAGFVIYPMFYRRYPSIFSAALLLSIVPEVVVEMHMAFGSRALFDEHFNIAHFLKIIAYIIPFIGLNLDYIRVYRKQKQQSENLESAIKEIRRSEQELHISNDKLKESNVELEKFAYVASHDLQEPLRKVQAFGDRLVTNYSDVLDDRGKDYITRMQKASTRMRTLIEDLLTFSRIGNNEIDFKSVNTNDVLAECLQDLSELIDNKHLIVNYPSLPNISGNFSQMTQVFQNILSNAAKFHRPDQPAIVDITFEQKLDAVNKPIVTLHFKDDGIGFDIKHSKKIFEVFQRLHGVNDYAGTGMGLAICRKIMLRHKGDINVTSELGQGSIFSLTFMVSN